MSWLDILIGVGAATPSSKREAKGMLIAAIFLVLTIGLLYIYVKLSST